VQTVDYEHIPFRCRKWHEHGHLMRDCPLSKIDNKGKPNSVKDTHNFQKVASKGKGGRKGSKQQLSGGKRPTKTDFKF